MAAKKTGESPARIGCNRLRPPLLRRSAQRAVLTGENGIFVPIII
jgi:hypothetical protein